MNNKTILDTLKNRSLEKKIAYIGLNESAEEVERISYENLFRETSSFSYFLHKNNFKRGENVVLLLNSDLSLLKAFYGCLLCGVCPILSKPEPHNRRFWENLTGIMADSATSSIITTKNIVDLAHDFFPTKKMSSKIICLDDFCPGDHFYCCSEVAPEDIAYLSYTSGSTGMPKGIKLLHKSLYNHAQIIRDSMDAREDSTIVSWLPLYHTAGLNVLMVQSLFVGAMGVLMPPESFVKYPLGWLKTMHKYGGTLTGAPNFAYDLCVELAHPQDLQNLDLSSWKVAFNASQIIKDSTLKNFINTFEKYGFSARTFRSFYGMTECVAAVAGGISAELSPPTQPKKGAHNFFDGPVASCGVPLPGCTIKIVESLSGGSIPCAPYEVGEIYIDSPGITGGYINEELNSAFNGKIEGDPKKYFCSGDLGFFDDHNNLFVCGRLKDFVIIRGKNIHFNDVDACLPQEDPRLSDNYLSFALVVGGEERLVAAIEIAQSITPKEGEQMALTMRNKILAAIGISPHTVLMLEPNAIPKTSVGKLQRHECKRLYATGQLKILYKYDFDQRETEIHISPDDDHLTKIIKIIASIGKITDPVAKDTKINSIGLDSLSATRIISQFRLYLGIELSIADVLFADTVDDILKKIDSPQPNDEKNSFAAFLDKQTKSKFNYENEFPLSHLQNEILGEEAQNIQKAPRENVYFCLQLEGNFRVELFKKSLELIIDQQKELGMIFYEKNGDYRQKYLKNNHQRIREMDFSAVDDAQTKINHEIRNVISGFFDLQITALQVIIFKKSSTEFVILFNMHHIIFDHWSLGVFLKSLFDCYGALEENEDYIPPPLDFEYVDFVEAELKWSATDGRKKQQLYWEKQLRAIPLLELNYDSERDNLESHNGAMIYFSIDADTYIKIREFSDHQRITVYMMLLGVFKLLMSKYSGQKDIVVGSAIANRSSGKIENIVGYFSNMLAIRSQIDLHEKFATFLTRIKNTVLEAQRHSHIPPEEVTRNLQNFPEVLPYRVAFLVQNTPKFSCKNDEFTIDFLPFHNEFCNFDMEVNILENNGRLDVTIEYCRDLFREKTINIFRDEYMAALRKILADETITVEKIISNV
ncbi:MAG: condensation domain-containing protein [Holosporaceae bacterium]|jgi:acyl-CoA synthetase (AMP-forming)/AMP-acid ligase II/acyl carrier protein|nr:condensation domain-containing protein [Holosporaceae bacterium]